jgi:ArsR family transcriptional regulator, cadmium/lead-responsive transcriptional repressor
VTDPGGVDAVFRALADPTRRDVLRLLARDGVGTPTGLAHALPVSRQAVTKHLAALAEAGLAERERAGRETRYRINAAPLHEALQWMAGVGSAWDRRLDALARVVDEPGSRADPRRGAGRYQ